jgi:hypothetical protein
MKRIFSPALLLVLAFGFGGSVFAQKVRLRSEITPNCSSGTSIWKFADIFADGNIAVQGSYNCRGAFIYDITNPDAPVLANWYNPGNNQQFLEAIVIGNRGYFGSGNGGGVHIVDLTNPYSPTLLGTVNSTTGNGHNSIHEMMVFDQDGSRYLLENYNSTATTKILKFINISNPASPVFKWDLTPTDPTWVHAMHIRENRLYLSGWGGKIDIYDISNLGGQTPNLLGSINVGSGNNHSSWTSEDGNYLYSCRELLDGDVRVYDVHDPAQPFLVRSIHASDLGLNAITPHNPVVVGNKLYVAWYQAGLQVFDISNPSNPVRIGQYDTFAPQFAPSDEEKALLDSGEPLDMICGGANLQNSLPTSYNGDWAVYPFLGGNKVLAGDLTSGLLVLDATKVALPSKNIVSDFDGDGKTDFSTYTPSTGDWNSEQSSTNSNTTVNWGGFAGDIAVNGDYDGDGKTDQAIFRPSTGTWWFIYSSNGSRPAVQFGLSGDVPVPADYDADGKTDIAVWRPSNGVWYINQSTLGMKYQGWGVSGDKVLTGDYEGDGKPDQIVWRPSNGVWYVLQSSSSIPVYAGFGLSGDKPLFADFDGDGRSELAVYRPSTGVWYALNPATNAVTAYQFGIAEDIPVPADYDGDGKADIAVFRPSTNVWYLLNSSNSTFTIRSYGQIGDVPEPSAVQPQ